MLSVPHSNAPAQTLAYRAVPKQTHGASIPDARALYFFLSATTSARRQISPSML